MLEISPTYIHIWSHHTQLSFALGLGKWEKGNSSWKENAKWELIYQNQNDWNLFIEYFPIHHLFIFYRFPVFCVSNSCCNNSALYVWVGYPSHRRIAEPRSAYVPFQNIAMESIDISLQHIFSHCHYHVHCIANRDIHSHETRCNTLCSR